MTRLFLPPMNKPDDDLTARAAPELVGGTMAQGEQRAAFSGGGQHVETDQQTAGFEGRCSIQLSHGRGQEILRHVAGRVKRADRRCTDCGRRWHNMLTCRERSS